MSVLSRRNHRDLDIVLRQRAPRRPDPKWLKSAAAKKAQINRLWWKIEHLEMCENAINRRVILFGRHFNPTSRKGKKRVGALVRIRSNPLVKAVANVRIKEDIEHCLAMILWLHYR